MSGQIPDDNDLLNKIVRSIESSKENNLQIIEGILSGGKV